MAASIRSSGAWPGFYATGGLFIYSGCLNTIPFYHVIEHCCRVIVVKVASCIQKQLECFQVVVVGRQTKETDVLVSIIVMTVENVTILRTLWFEMRPFLINSTGIRFHLLTWLEFFESDVATDAPETNSGENNRVERINEIILMTDHL